jgi:hypothetical protein
LKRGSVLLRDYGLGELTDKRVVAAERPKGRLYTFFENHRDLFNYIQNIDFADRCLHEVCLGYAPQKPRFDIDIHLNDLTEDETLESLGQQVLDVLLEAILEVLADVKPALDLASNILLLSSHSSTKRSYHLIITGRMHIDHHEAWAFYEKVVATSSQPDLLQKCCDPGIYSSNHLLRMLGNHKLGETRIFEYEPEFTFRGQKIVHRPYMVGRNEQHEKFIIFTESLISFVAGCELMPLYIRNQTFETEVDVNDSMMKRCLELLAQYCQVQVDRLPFQVREILGPIVDLKRLQPSYCKLCKRSHEVVDCFLLILGNDVYFNCRRAGKGAKFHQFLGHLGEMVTQITLDRAELFCDTEGAASTDEYPEEFWETPSPPSPQVTPPGHPTPTSSGSSLVSSASASGLTPQVTPQVTSQIPQTSQVCVPAIPINSPIPIQSYNYVADPGQLRSPQIYYSPPPPPSHSTESSNYHMTQVASASQVPTSSSSTTLPYQVKQLEIIIGDPYTPFDAKNSSSSVDLMLDSMAAMRNPPKEIPLDIHSVIRNPGRSHVRSRTSNRRFTGSRTTSRVTASAANSALPHAKRYGLPVGPAINSRSTNI